MSLSLQAIQKHLEQQGILSRYQAKMRLAQITIIPRILLYVEDHLHMPFDHPIARENPTGILLVIDHYGVARAEPHQVRIIDHSPRLTPKLANNTDVIHRIPTSDPQLLQKITHIVNKAIKICRETTDVTNARI